MFGVGDAGKFKEQLPKLSKVPGDARVGMEVIKEKSEIDEVMIKFRENDQAHSDHDRQTGSVLLKNKRIDGGLLKKPEGARTISGSLNYDPATESLKNLDADVDVDVKGASFKRKFEVNDQGESVEYKCQDTVSKNKQMLQTNGTFHIDKTTGLLLDFSESKRLTEFREDNQLVKTTTVTYDGKTGKANETEDKDLIHNDGHGQSRVYHYPPNEIF